MICMNLLLKAGAIEGQVVEMGLITTSLLNAEKFPVIVPNSLFSSQVCCFFFTYFLLSNDHVNIDPHMSKSNNPNTF